MLWTCMRAGGRGGGVNVKSYTKCYSVYTFNLKLLCLIPWDPTKECLGYVRNPRSLMEGTETLCRDDIGDLPGSPEHLWLRENANEIG